MVDPINDHVHEALIDIFSKMAIKHDWKPITTLYNPAAKIGKKVDVEAKFSRDDQTLTMEIMGSDLRLTISQEYPAITNIVINSQSQKTVNAFYLAHNTKIHFMGDPKLLRKVRQFVKPRAPVVLYDYEWYHTYTKS